MQAQLEQFEEEKQQPDVPVGVSVFCLSCRAHRSLAKVHEERAKSNVEGKEGRLLQKGECPHCGKRVTCFAKMP